MFCTEWLLARRCRIVCERQPANQVFYLLPVESILGKLSVVPDGDTGTIPYYCMRQHSEDFVGAAFDTREGASDGSRWWYINTVVSRSEK
jgi:hypothetical protein